MSGSPTSEAVLPLVDLIRRESRPLTPIDTGLSPELPSLSPARAILFDVYGTMFVSGSGDIATNSSAQSGAGSTGDPHGEAVFEQALRTALRAWSPTGAIREPAARAGQIYFETIEREHRRRRRLGIEYPEVDIVEVWRTVLATLLQDQPNKPNQPNQSQAVPDEPGTAPNQQDMPEWIQHEHGARRSGHGLLEWLALTFELANNPVWPMPGLRETLAALAARGYRMGIVSNAQFYTPLLFEALLDRPPDSLGIDPALCIWSYQVGEAKPSPMLFGLAAETLHSRHGISPSETVYIGNDMRNDILAAANAGFRTVLFAGDARSLRMREEDPASGSVQPEAIITRLEQLSAVLRIGKETWQSSSSP